MITLNCSSFCLVPVILAKHIVAEVADSERDVGPQSKGKTIHLQLLNLQFTLVTVVV